MEQDAISIIIPTFNENEYISSLISYLKLHTPGNTEIIVADGGSTDDTIASACAAGAKVVKSDKKGRAAQMNCGAAFAEKNILYFVHADCLPPENFFNNIIMATKNNFELGRFQTKFNSKSFLLKLNAFFTRFDWFICNGGDQTLFIKKDVFNKIGGFNTAMLLMEDYDIVKRARENFKYIVLKEKVLISARKYNKNSWLKVQKAHYKIIKMYRSGEQQEKLVAKYKQLINYR